MRLRLASALACTLVLVAPAAAKESLGIFGEWGAFRDPAVPRCYAIAAAQPSSRERETRPYASVGSWPERQVRGQFYLRLSRARAPGSDIALSVGREQFTLVGTGHDGWPADARDNARILSAMRSGAAMSARARDKAGRSFTDRYSLAGAATALDAASVGCAKRG